MLITKIWKNQPGKFFCISTKSKTKGWKDHFFSRGDFDDIKEFLEDNADKDLYFCPHGFTKARRLKEYAEIPKMLWADLDECDPRELKELMPTIAWESSPGRFCGIWYLDTFMTEELNQKLSYKIGADRGGWDLTQVLRIPGTLNYKYESTPKVRTLWSDGPEYATRDIEKHLPKEKVSLDKKVIKGNIANELYRKYEKKFSGWLRRELINGKPKPGKRSEVIWKLSHELIEAGCSRDEAFELLRVSPWNKFKDRRDGEEQLRRELNKALAQKLKVVKTREDDAFEAEEDVEPDEGYTFLAKSMMEVQAENLDWLWYPYLARGELTILEGDPGLGKSYMAQMVAKSIVDGDKLPSPKRIPLKPDKIAYFDMENSAGTVTKKRLVNNGCVNLQNYYQEEEPFSIDDESSLENVYEAIEKLKPALVVFDTVNTYIGKADTHKSAEVQQAFKTFVEIARRFNCSVLVLRHLNKSSGDRAIYRGQGSIAFTGLARVVMTVGEHPEEYGTRVMAITKINVTKPPRALTFRIESLPDTLKEQDRSKFEWGEWVDLSCEDILKGGAPIDMSNRGEEIMDFLGELLAAGPMQATAVVRAGEARGISKKSIYKYAAEMGLVTERKGFSGDKGSMWALPNRGDKRKRVSDELDE